MGEEVVLPKMTMFYIILSALCLHIRRCVCTPLIWHCAQALTLVKNAIKSVMGLRLVFSFDPISKAFCRGMVMRAEDEGILDPLPNYFHGFVKHRLSVTSEYWVCFN